MLELKAEVGQGDQGKLAKGLECQVKGIVYRQWGATESS